MVVQRRHRAPSARACSSSHSPTSSPSSHEATVAVQRAAPLGAVDGDVPPAVREPRRVGHPHVGLAGQGVQPRLLGGDVGGGALRVGVDPQRQATPVGGVERGRSCCRRAAPGRGGALEAEPVGGGTGHAPEHLDLGVLVEGGVRRVHWSYGRAMRLPYGTWTSSITPESLATGQVSLDEVRVEGRDTYWLAGRPSEAGRTALMAHDGTQAREVLPAPWDVRTRVHEYGGGAYAVQGGTIVFSHAGDDRLYRLDPGAGEPVAVTPPGPWRFGGVVVHERHVYAVREDHSRDPGTGQRARAARPRRRQHRGWSGARHRHRLRLPPRGLARRPVDRLGRLGPPEHAVGLHRAAAGRAHRGGHRNATRRRRRCRRLGRPAGLRSRRRAVVPLRRVGVLDRAPRQRLRPGGAPPGPRRPRRASVGPGRGRPRRDRCRPCPGPLVGRRRGPARRARRPHRGGPAARDRGRDVRPAPGRRRRGGPAARAHRPAPRGGARTGRRPAARAGPGG